MRGRKPMPSRIKLLRGNPGKRPLPQEEPQPQRGLPPAPSHLNALALVEWHRIGGALARLGVLTQVDSSVLAGYCVVYARWAMAETALQQPSDLLVRGQMSGNIQNPLIRIANQALELMHKYMVEMGLTPSSRTRVVKGEPSVDDPLEQFLAKKKTRK